MGKWVYGFGNGAAEGTGVEAAGLAGVGIWACTAVAAANASHAPLASDGSQPSI